MSVMKKVIRKLLGRSSQVKVPKDAFINVDFAALAGSDMILLGWMKKSQLAPSDLLARNSGAACSSYVFSYARDDVAAQLGSSVASDVKGFVLLVKGQNKTENMELVLGDRTLELNKHRFQVSRSVDSLLNHVGAERSSAMSFLKKHNVDLEASPAEGSSLKSSRPLDPDVEKIKQQVSKINLSRDDWVAQCQQNILPAVQKIWKERHNQAVAKCVTYGRISETPCCSVVVPLYGRYDFMQYQLSAFSADPTMSDAEIIYVLDDPQLTHEVSVTAHGLSKTFSMPFKVVYLDKNLGFAGANNQGAKHATSQHLLMLNSDILPIKPGWLKQLIEQFNALDKPGVLGATLLYEDNSIQHCGMRFTREPNVPGIYLNHHPYKGIPVNLVELPAARPVLLTTGACMLMATERYHELGGFDTNYVIGDFEDSDLCMRFAETGCQNYVSGVVQLYHLERLSQSMVSADNWKQKLTFANAAYQQQQWLGKFEALEQRFDNGWGDAHGSA